jgi:hypothetical protein
VGAVVSAELPNGRPAHGESRERHAAWVSEATRHDVVATWRPGRTEASAIVVRLLDGRELFFETVAEASRPDRFITAFMALDGIVMPPYVAWQVREIVGALVRMAQIDREQDELDAYADAGARFLVGCLRHGGGRVEVKLDAEDYAERLATYRAIVRYEIDLSRRHGDPTEPPWVAVLHATDRKRLHVPRGLFGTFAKRTIRGVTGGTFNAQMRRLDWVDLDLQPRKPKPPEADATFKEAKRPRLRLWAIADGWDGITADDNGQVAADRGDAETPGDASTGARAGARASLYPGVSTSPRAHGRRPA